MGICKFQDIWKTLFSWVLPVPENAHKAKCKYCPGKLFDIKCGSQALKRHEAFSNHMKAVTSVAGSSIVAQSWLHYQICTWFLLQGTHYF